MASYGPTDNFANAEEIITSTSQNLSLSEEELQDKIASFKLENSYIGIIGKTIEPVIQPLGYDWKIGIGIVASFAAREVFVGTMATIYSVGSHSEEENTIKEKMRNEVNSVTGKPIYTFASGISLLLFYAFAMQCMSTLAIVKKETNSWKWPIIQLLFMSGLAYLVALTVFQFLK
jgi:ferrous iron transport protein B